MVGWRASLSTTRSAPPLPLPRQNPQESSRNWRNNNERIASYVRSSSLYLSTYLSLARRKCPMEKRFVREEYPRDEGLFERGRFSRGGDVTRDGNPSNHEAHSGSFQNAHNALCRVARRYVMHPVCLPAEYHLLSLSFYLIRRASRRSLLSRERVDKRKGRGGEGGNTRLKRSVRSGTMNRRNSPPPFSFLPFFLPSLPQRSIPRLRRCLRLESSRVIAVADIE